MGKTCTIDKDCPFYANCVNNTCQCNREDCCFDDNDCFSTQECLNGRCFCKGYDIHCCTSSFSCFAGKCRDGICHPNEEGSACVYDIDCSGLYLFCKDHVCKYPYNFKAFYWIIGVTLLLIALGILILFCIMKCSKRRPRMNQLNPVQLNQSQQPESAQFYPPPVGTQGYPMTAAASYPTAPPPISAPVGTPGYPPYPPPPPVTSV